jgi:hypothetical protein
VRAVGKWLGQFSDYPVIIAGGHPGGYGGDGGPASQAVFSDGFSTRLADWYEFWPWRKMGLFTWQTRWICASGVFERMVSLRTLPARGVATAPSGQRISAMALGRWIFPLCIPASIALDANDALYIANSVILENPSDPQYGQFGQAILKVQDGTIRNSGWKQGAEFARQR